MTDSVTWRMIFSQFRIFLPQQIPAYNAPETFHQPDCLLFLFICKCYSLFCQWFLFTAVSHEDGRIKIIIIILCHSPRSSDYYQQQLLHWMAPLSLRYLLWMMVSSWNTLHSSSDHGVYQQKKNDILFFLLGPGVM